MAYLGIDEAACEEEESQTAGGLTTRYCWRPGIDVEVHQMARMVTVRANSSSGLPPRLVLLGRKDFFFQFRVEVDERTQTFSLDPYDP